LQICIQSLVSDAHGTNAKFPERPVIALQHAIVSECNPVTYAFHDHGIHSEIGEARADGILPFDRAQFNACGRALAGCRCPAILRWVPNDRFMTAKGLPIGLHLVMVPALLGCCLSVWAESSEVRLAGQPGRFQLLRNGQPYFIRGAGADERLLRSVAAAGGNSIRLWGDEKLGESLNTAQELGLTVCAGLWVGQVRQGFDWSNADALAQLRERLRATVTRYKDHPALLLWAIGNEMEDPQGKNAAVWSGINDLAAMIKQIDPGHPTMTVIAEIGGEKVKNIHRLCPAIDIVGINSYGGAPTLGARYSNLGGRSLTSSRSLVHPVSGR
jgi:hypothetical protein